MKTFLKSALLFSVFIIVFGFIGFVVGSELAELDVQISGIDYVVFAALFMVSYHLGIIVHELGHLMFGRLVGLKFLSFRYFSFLIKKTQDNRYEFKRFSIRGTAGQCLMIPNKEVDLPLFWYNAGGVILNAGLLSISAGVYVFHLHPYIKAFLIFSIFINALLIILNWFPLKHIPNDGNNYREAKKHKASQDAMKNILIAHADLAYGKRLRESDIDRYDISALDLSQKLQLTYALLIATNHLYAQRFDDYTASINHIVKHADLKKGMHALLIKPYIYFNDLLTKQEEALINKDKQLRSLLKNMKYEAFFVLIRWYESLLTHKVSDPRLEKAFFKVCETSPTPGESLDLIELFHTLNKNYETRARSKNGITPLEA